MTLAERIKQLITTTDEIISGGKYTESEVAALRDAIEKEDRSVYLEMEAGEAEMDTLEELEEIDECFVGDMIEESLKQTDIHNKLYLAFDFIRDAKGKNEGVLRDVKLQLEEALETAEML